MRLKVACVLSVATFFFASSARADETVWNPFLFTPFCSTCGPQSPLTLELADGVQILFGPQGLGPAIPVTPPPIDDNDFTTPPDNVGRQGPPTLSVLPPASSGGSGSVGSGGSGGSGSNSSNSGNNQNSGGVGYGVNANPNVVTFTTNDGNTNGLNTDVLSDTSGGGDQSGGQTLVPEPTTLVLFGTGLALVSTRLRRRRNTQR